MERKVIREITKLIEKNLHLRKCRSSIDTLGNFRFYKWENKIYLYVGIGNQNYEENFNNIKELLLINGYNIKEANTKYHLYLEN